MAIRIPNLTNSLVWVGVGLVALSLIVPARSAERTARVETRAEEAARTLLAVAQEMEPIDLDDLDAARRLESRFRAACAEWHGHPESYLPHLHECPSELSDVSCMMFESKHYCLMLTRSPIPIDSGVQPDRYPFEVYAWPLSLSPPGHTAFFVPEIGDPAFSRNKMRQYVGWKEDRRGHRALPRPGCGIPRNEVEEGAYRGRDDERWILLQ
ncbi:MAG: hypothetical protein KDB80_16730 [Planctomycetes bacterium]|nr:hypothetical protein [Planctomycetota bacterium]